MKFQTLPYIPSKDVGFKTTLYSKSPSIYTNVKEIAKSRGWKPELAALHQNTAPEGPMEKYIKYVSPDGKREVIFDHTGTRIITEDRDVGTYNYADPDLWLAHTLLDILPWIVYGNTPEDKSLLEKIRGALDFENYKNYFANHKKNI